MPESLQYRLAQWRVNEVLAKYPCLRLLNTRNGGIQIAGMFSFIAAVQGRTAIQDDYQVQINVPEVFPKPIRAVYETGGRIPHGRGWFGHLHYSLRDSIGRPEA